MSTLHSTNTFGHRHPNAGTTSRYQASVTAYQYAVAGPNSSGLVVNNYAACNSVQFGTSPSEPNGAVPSSAYTVTADQVLSGSDIRQIVYHSNGDQSLGNGRILWKASDKSLVLSQRQSDAPVSNCPRCQYYFQSLPNNSFYYKITLDFELKGEVPWPLLTGEDNVLIFQVNPDVGAVPPINLQVRAPSNGLEDFRNLVLLRRTDNYSNQTPGGPNDGAIGDGTGESYVYLLENVPKSGRHLVELTWRPDWRDTNEGGSPFLRMQYQGLDILCHEHSGAGNAYVGRNIYPITGVSTGNYLYLLMIGIYRTTYRDQTPPDGCSITFHKFEVSTHVRPPP
jgi:hypothetical protein